MAKDAPAELAPEVLTPPVAKAPTRLETLRAKLAEIAPGVKVERVEADAKAESKAHVKCSFGRKRVAHVVEPPHSLDDAECAVLTVVIAHHMPGAA